MSQYTEGTVTSEYEKELQLILLNSPNKEGKFIHQEVVFKDTKEDFELFKALNEDVFNRIENSSNKDVVFPANIAIGKAALPKRFAEWLQQ